MLYMGIDLGTSSVKLLLMDEMGRIHKIVSRDYPISFPHPEWVEHAPKKLAARNTGWYKQSRKRQQQR